ncbi:MAG: glycosyltransferase family 39 protein [Planctomycetota bacterium]|nr:glycosyltransferase family 39 protein [Planctomycetota bacterium]
MSATRSTTNDISGATTTSWKAALLLLFILPLALRLVPVDHGLPRSYVPDSHAVRAALGMVRDKDPVPPVGKYSTYPNLLPYTFVPAYAVVYAAGRVSGDWDSPEAYGSALIGDPGLTNLIARLVVVLYGVLTVWAVFKGARAAGLEAGAWCAAWLVATGCLHIHLSVQERPWVPMVFYQALCLWAAAAYVKSSKPKHLIACSVAAGLSFACHQSGLATFALCGLAWLFALKEGVGNATIPQRLLAGVGALAAGLVAALLLGHPYLLVHGITETEGVVGGAMSDISIGGQGIVFGFRWQSLKSLSAIFLSYDPVLIVLGLAGAATAWRRPSMRPALCFAGLWGGFFLTQQNDHVRYLSPLTILLALLAGSFFDKSLGRGLVGRGALCLLVLPLIQGVRFGQVLNASDVRVEAEELLAALPKGSLVAIDRYGPAVDLDAASLELLRGLRAEREEGLRTRELWRAKQLEQGIGPQGTAALAVEELFDFDERGAELHVREQLVDRAAGPAELLRELGVTHVLLVDRISGDGSSNLLVGELGETRSLWTLGPWREGCAPGEARLPHELHHAARTLWAVDRPGPRLELVELVD